MAGFPTAVGAPAQGALGHRILLLANGIAAAVAVGLGLRFVDMRLAAVGVCALLLLAGWATWLGPRAGASRFLLTASLMGFVALHIQLAQGMLEFHFGVFVALAFLLAYRDWRVVVFGAGVIAAHHVLFDRLQAAGFGVYCTTEPDFARIVLHAAFVVVQSGIEVVLALGMQRAAREGEELRRLVAAVDREGRIALDLAGCVASTPAALALRATLERMRDVVSTVRASAVAVEAASTEIASGHADLSARTDEQAQALQLTAASMQHLDGSARANAGSASEADQLARAASEVAERGGATMQQVVERMHAIRDSSHRVAEITGVIDAIAFQTNILALNAAVEAARAGDQGRGFAVVASEVRRLAQRSAEAARQIGELLTASGQQVDDGTRLVAQAGETMGEIVQAISRVSGIVSRISQAGAAQSEGFSEVGAAVARMDQVTRQNASLVEQGVAAAGGLRHRAQGLVEAVSAFLLPEPQRAGT